MPSPPRYHHLDALRAFAMLLGIVLHGIMSFIALPVWPAQDVQQNHVFYSYIKDFIHGFRLPLFFLLSGFFTTMLWQKRGLRGLIGHRVRRILWPLVAATLLSWPLLIGVSYWGKSAQAQLASNPPATIWEAAARGDLRAIHQFSSTGIGLDGREPLGMTTLFLASLHGQADAIDLLVTNGANVNVRNNDGFTPLHAAAFFGRREAARRLLGHGADPALPGGAGSTALDAAQTDWQVVNTLARVLNLRIERPRTQRNRADIVTMIEATIQKNPTNGIHSPLTTFIHLLFIGSILPLFQHLWFLYYLLWLVALFASAILIKRRFRLPKIPLRFLQAPYCLLWLLPLTFLPQLLMRQSFGPDTAPGPIPWPPKLAYYAIFFAYGAFTYKDPMILARAGRYWRRWFLIAASAFGCGAYAFYRYAPSFSFDHLLTTGCAVLYAWTMIFGCLGLCSDMFPQESPRLRYISDASYWLYLAHLPVVVAFQIMLMTWPLPSLVKVLIICGLTFLVLMALYASVIRYSFIGTMLNGKRTRPSHR